MLRSSQHHLSMWSVVPNGSRLRSLGHRGVGDVQEAGANAGAFAALLGDRVDVADQGDVDRAAQVGDDVGEFSGAAVTAEVDVALERLV